MDYSSIVKWHLNASSIVLYVNILSFIDEGSGKTLDTKFEYGK